MPGRHCRYARRRPQTQALQAQRTAQQCDGAETQPPRAIRPRPCCALPWAHDEGGHFGLENGQTRL
eukprot:1771978-Alexandrium_andersonii.AAC.1